MQDQFERRRHVPKEMTKSQLKRINRSLRRAVKKERDKQETMYRLAAENEALLAEHHQLLQNRQDNLIVLPPPEPKIKGHYPPGESFR